MLAYFGIALGGETPSLFFKLCSALADASIFTLLCSLLRGRWKVIGIAIPWSIGVLLLVNLLYFRNFSDLIPASQYTLTGITDPTVTVAARNSIRPADLVLILCPLIPTVWLALRYKEITCVRHVSLRVVRTIAVGTLIFWGITLAGAIRRQRIYHATESFGATWELVFPKHSTNIKFFTIITT